MVIWQSRRWFLLQTGTPPRLALLGAGLSAALATQMIMMSSEGLEGRPHVQLLWFVISLTVVVCYMIDESAATARAQAKNHSILKT